ncbi:interleukin-21 receptor [Embiotoca jacksoni]|uniref:interleukin-21 receptor n=1 Tax=Embiotoca jacksoni TaxID=100190 RepID=UPI003703F5F9
MPLIIFLLKSTGIIWMNGYPIAGAKHNLHCVNDYLLTVNCSLSIPPSGNTSNSNSSYWLTFTEIFERTVYVCMLTNTEENFSCSFTTADKFVDTDSYEISLCPNRNNRSEICELLDDEYEPVTNIKLNAPCCLTFSHNSSQHHFTWNSTYEEYSLITGLTESLQYHLHYYQRGNKPKAIHDIKTGSTDYFVDNDKFLPDTEYAVKVRSSPNQVSYMGQWSDWSSEFHWKTEPVVKGSELGKKVFLPICVSVLLVVLLCYSPVKKWRQSAFIPTPAPYFHTLYSECQGDFKTWVVTQDNSADVLKVEETLQIDTLTKCPDVQEEDRPPRSTDQQPVGDNAYGNICVVCDAAHLGITHAASTAAPLSAPESKARSVALSSGSPAGDSGCWLCSGTPLETDLPWYCNQYCTLSGFPQPASVSAEHRGSM